MSNHEYGSSPDEERRAKALEQAHYDWGMFANTRRDGYAVTIFGGDWEPPSDCATDSERRASELADALGQVDPDDFNDLITYLRERDHEAMALCLDKVASIIHSAGEKAKDMAVEEEMKNW